MGSSSAAFGIVSVLALMIGTGQAFAAPGVKCCSGCSLVMCGSPDDWQFCTGCSCPNRNGDRKPDGPPSVNTACGFYDDVKNHPKTAMAKHRAMAALRKVEGRYTGSLDDAACVWCDCFAMLKPVCEAPDPNAFQPLPWENETDVAARLLVLAEMGIVNTTTTTSTTRFV